MTEAEKLSQRIADHRRSGEELLRDILSAQGITGDDFVNKALPQSQLFMAELIPVIHRLYGHEPNNALKTVLDIGPQNFAGTQLLADIHSKKSYTRLKLEISALDIVPNFKQLQELFVPNCEFIISDLFAIEDRSWDMVIASHVIEHVPNPVKFVKKMQSVARDFVLIACPWNEFPITSKTHVNTIDKNLTKKFGARDLQIFTNYSWGKDREVCIFWVPGTAGKPEPTE